MTKNLFSCAGYSIKLGVIGLLSATALSGCGFKSDLFQPDSQADNPLFQRDSQPAVETETTPPYLSTEGFVEGEILLDKVGENAVDGKMTDMSGDGEVDGADGIVIDLTDLSRDVERDRTSQ